MWCGVCGVMWCAVVYCGVSDGRCGSRASGGAGGSNRLSASYGGGEAESAKSPSTVKYSGCAVEKRVQWWYWRASIVTRGREQPSWTVGPNLLWRGTSNNWIIIRLRSSGHHFVVQIGIRYTGWTPPMYGKTIPGRLFDPSCTTLLTSTHPILRSQHRSTAPH